MLVRRITRAPLVLVLELNWPSSEPLAESVRAVVDSIGEPSRGPRPRRLRSH